MAEIAAQLAPGDEDAPRLGIAENDGPDGPRRLLSGFTAIAERELPSVADRAAERCEIDRILRQRRLRAQTEAWRFDIGPQPFRHGGGDLGEEIARGERQCPVSAVSDPLRAQHYGLDLGRAEHQRRHVVLFGQDIAEACRARDRHSLADEGGDIAIDRAGRDLQLGGERRGGNRPGRAAENLDDLEQPVGAAHGVRPSC